LRIFVEHFVKQFVKNFVEAFEGRLGLGFPTGRVRVCEFVGFLLVGGWRIQAHIKHLDAGIHGLVVKGELQ
jgi:hypothetical protein